MASDDTNKVEPLDFAQFISNDNLNLSGLGLTDHDIREVMHFLLSYPAIKTVDLSLNHIGDQGVSDFAERNLTVTQVNFTGNNISDRGLAVFAYKNYTVTQANFSQNPISDEGITAFAEINQVCYASQFSKIRLH